MKIIKSRLFKVLVILFIFGFILGIISFFIFNKNNNEIVNYYMMIKNNKINYLNSFFNSILYNYKYISIIFIFGLIFFLSFLTPLIIIFRGISLGFTLISIICSFKMKGLILGLILLFPVGLLNELIFILISYYSIHFSFKVYNAIKNNKNINIKSFCKNYLIIFLIFLSILTISSLFETFISSNIIKFVL